MANYQKINKNLKKILGENWPIFALDPKLEMDTETLILHSGQKFMCFVVHFHKKFWFWYQTEIVPKKVYAAIWPILEISSLKSLSKGREKLVVYEPCVQYNVSFAEIFEQNNHEWPSEADPKWPVSKCIGESNFFSNRVLQLLTSDYIQFFDKPCVHGDL